MRQVSPSQLQLEQGVNGIVPGSPVILPQPCNLGFNYMLFELFFIVSEVNLLLLFIILHLVIKYIGATGHIPPLAALVITSMERPTQITINGLQKGANEGWCLFLLFWVCHVACRILVPLQWQQSPNHWTREFLNFSYNKLMN